MNPFKQFLLTIYTPNYPQHTEVPDTKLTWTATQKKDVEEKAYENITGEWGLCRGESFIS